MSRGLLPALSTSRMEPAVATSWVDISKMEMIATWKY